MIHKTITAGAFALLLTACASSVPSRPAALAPLGAVAAELELAAASPVALSTGYERTLPARSRWQAVGELPEGLVYRPAGTVFTIEGRHVHEAYLVVRQGVLQGFYLAGESRYSPLDKPIPLTLDQKKQP